MKFRPVQSTRNQRIDGWFVKGLSLCKYIRALYVDLSTLPVSTVCVGIHVMDLLICIREEKTDTQLLRTTTAGISSDHLRRGGFSV